MKLRITIGDKYRPAMEITDQAEADRYWEQCVEHNLRCQKAEGTKPDRAKAESVEKQNLGYFAGYYSHETRERVERLFLCAHPVFGKAAEHKPTPQEAFDAGRAAGAGVGDKHATQPGGPRSPSAPDQRPLENK